MRERTSRAVERHPTGLMQASTEEVRGSLSPVPPRCLGAITPLPDKPTDQAEAQRKVRASCTRATRRRTPSRSAPSSSAAK